MGLRFTYPRSIVLIGIAVMVCGPLLGVVGAAAADAATTTTTVAPKPSTTTTTTTTKPPVTTTTVGPGDHDHDGTGDNDHRRGSGARRPVDHHDHGATARRQPAQHQCADAARRGAQRQGRAVPEQQWRDVTGDRTERPELPELPGRAVSLRLQGTRHSHARRQRRLQARALHCVP